MSEFLNPRIRKEKHEHPGVDLLVDTGEYIENDVVSKLWINVPEFFEPSGYHAQ